MPNPPAPPALDPAVHRALGVGLYNRTWDLLRIAARTSDEDDELVHTAHASAWHWRQVSDGVERARSEWLCARVHAGLGHGDAAVRHARRCLEILSTRPAGQEDWDEAAASEAMARALFVAGDRAASDEWRARAVAALEAVADAEDRSVIEEDLATLARW